MSPLTRREFLKLVGASGTAALALLADRKTAFLQTAPGIDNPLQFYPNRDWERVYRNIYRHDSQFVFLCAPNDTHNCLLKAHVRHGVMTRIEPSYGYHEAVDAYGNQASARWEPRICNKGMALVRRVYGDRRIKGAMIRKGWLDWARGGFPRDPDTGLPPRGNFRRGEDEWVKVPWDEAFALVARALETTARTYSGPQGAELLRKQGYDEAMIEAMKEAGVQTCKFRGGMPFLGATRIFGLNRFANMLALLDVAVRKPDADHTLGARIWDSYSWHTDLPPGHPMVTGQQTVDFDLFTAENAKLITLWGMNWISTKMPDGHWLTEARLRGAKVVVIATEYQSTAQKADQLLVIRPGTDTALALGMSAVIMKEKLYDADFVKGFTDLPLLVRLDTRQYLRAADVIQGHQAATLSNFTQVLKAGETPKPNAEQNVQYIPAALRDAWGDYMVWDTRAGQPAVVTRDEVGKFFLGKGVEPALEGTFKVKTVDGKEVEVRSVFDLVREYLEEFSPQVVSEITWTPPEVMADLARQIARNPEATLLVHGMGPNHFFNNDLKDRALFLLGALTRNIGFVGGTPGSYAGNYRTSIYNGEPQYITEDPFNIELDPEKPAKTKSYAKYESAHYYNYGDRPLRVGNKLFTGKTHLPTPTKFAWWANSNSVLGNAKGAYDVIVNTLPRIETVVANDWWWTMTCEYADVVFGVDAWAEMKYPDMCGSVTNPFVQMFPRTPLPRTFDTRGDVETFAGVAKALGTQLGDSRCEDYWRFIFEGRAEAYLQRIINASSSLRGYRVDELHARAARGIPALKMMRTYPKIVGWEQSNESRPWYTKTGRCEFYREEPEFLEYGENLPVYREPVDATFYEPNAMVGKPGGILQPTPPQTYGLKPDDVSVEVRQVRNVMRPWSEVKETQHPLRSQGYTHVFITPKFRHGTHTTPVDVDIIAAYFGPFGDMYRRDKRAPWVSEAYADINPEDAKAQGIEDGDYIWIDADPSDRPYRGWKPDDANYKIMRLMARARYYTGMPRGILRMWFHLYQATHGSVEGQQTRPDGLAKSPRTNYQAYFRSGGHQSCTRAWLRPTLMTDSLVRKEGFGQLIGTGFAADIHCTTGAPKESFVKITKAEPGGVDGEVLWRPAALGYRPTYENDAMKKFLQGGFVTG
ncbi:MAG: molybdopterin-dependent oxidoreductase [Anaerolineae bacterium]|nr:molybdopterin-dependent oxidoreductase [Anaerolineae bacterium]